MTRRSHSLRWGAALTALAYLLGWMLLLAHNVTEQHVVCLEHGELVHADEADHADDTDVVAAEENHHSVESFPAHDDHDHCTLGPFLRDDDVAVTGHAATVAPDIELEWREPLSFVQSPRAPPISALSLAPKTSPPHHA